MISTCQISSAPLNSRIFSSVSAFSFGKRALAAGAASNAGTILMRKSGSISAYAAEQLGELDSAKSLRDLSAGKVDYFTIQGKI